MGNVTTTISEASETTAVSRSGGRRRTIITGAFTFSNSYATGGDSITFPSGYGTLKALLISPYTLGVRIFAWDGTAATPKLKAFTAIGTEVTSTTDLSAVTVNYVAVFEQG